jgi:hypothetical protein
MECGAPALRLTDKVHLHCDPGAAAPSIDFTALDT